MAASEALAIERLGPADVAGGLALSDAAGWNQTADDWAVFIAAGAAFGVRDEAATLIATAAALPYDAVDRLDLDGARRAAHRHRGIASQLVDACVASLRDAGRIAGARRDAGGRRRVREDRLRRRVRVRALGRRRCGGDRGADSGSDSTPRSPPESRAERGGGNAGDRRKARAWSPSTATPAASIARCCFARSCPDPRRARGSLAGRRLRDSTRRPPRGAGRSDRRRGGGRRARAARQPRSTASPAAPSSTSRSIARRSPTP